MADARDILGVGASGGAPERKPEKKERMKRPEGMSREAFALLSGSNPLVTSQLMEGLKKGKKDKLNRPTGRGTVVWRQRPFTNEARIDGLQLVHWAKGFKDANGSVRDAHEGEYQYAKFNKKCPVYRYDEEEWANLINEASSGWSREETDHLINMVEQFDQRFIVIADRWDFPNGPPRTLEDLKERYYGVARKLLIAREGTDATIANHPLVKHPYNAAQDRQRKAALMSLLDRDTSQEERDNQVLEQARQIEERRRAEDAAAKAAAAAAAQARRAATAAPAPAPAAPARGGSAGPSGSGGGADAAASAAAAATTAAAGGAPPHVAQVAPPVASAMPAAAMAPPSYDPAAYLMYPAAFENSVPPGTPTLLSATVEPVRPPPGVYARGVYSKAMVEQQPAAILGQNAQRLQKQVEGMFAEFGVPLPPKFCSRSLTGSYLAMRGEVLHLAELRRQQAARMAAARPGDPKRKTPGDGGSAAKRQKTSGKR